VKRGILVAVATAVAKLYHVEAASATLVFSRFNGGKKTIWGANDDGSAQRRLATNAATPQVTPDGQTVFFQTTDANRTDLRQMPVAGGPAKTVVRGLQYGIQTISPDGAYLLVNTGPLNGAQKLTLLTVATGATRTIATGYFYGASFAPDGTQFAYSRARGQSFKARNDVYLAAVAGGAPRNLTSDGHSAYPVWGPTQIAFSRWRLHYGPKRAESGPAYNITVINPDGSGRRNVTNTKVPYLLSGLIATDWSADGTKLLTQFTGQDPSYAVGVDMASGKTHVIGPKTELGLNGAALTADGGTVLGTLGPPEEVGNVVTIPFAGGTAKPIVRRAFEPFWTVP
jgi:Tol biopolymer transport system component